MEDIQLFNDDCFNIFPKLEDKSINLFILDLPYANLKFGKCTACKWDSPIDLEEMWKHIKRIMKPNALIVFFCDAKFGYCLIDSNPKWFKYQLIWKKSRKVGFLSANRKPLVQHENIYVFKDKAGTYNPQKTEGKPYTDNRRGTGYYGDLGDKYTKDHKIINKGDRHPTSIIDHENIYVFDNDTKDKDILANRDLREYAKKLKKYLGISQKEWIKKKGYALHSFFYRTEGASFGLPNKKTYDELIKEYNIDEMENYLEYDILESLWEGNPTYNPQKTEGTPYKTNGGKMVKSVYGSVLTANNVNKGDRHPTSIIPEYEGDTILVYKNPHKTIHRTQKPVELLEWLIKTYSNEGDTVMDFTMGSGTCAIGCINTKRKFIGVEMDKEIYDLAFDRIEKHKKNIVE